MVQAIVVVEVLVAERNTKHPLAQHVHHALATLPRWRASASPRASDPVRPSKRSA